jgi:type II secretory pathway component PulF
MGTTEKWVIGGFAAIAAFILTFVLRYQDGIDASQDMDRANIRTESVNFRKEQQVVNQKLSEGSRVIAEALKEVATTLKEVDSRGSQALREHERMRGEGAH